LRFRVLPFALRRGGPGERSLPHREGGRPARALALELGCERSLKIKFNLKIKRTYFENKSNTILKIKDLAAKIK